MLTPCPNHAGAYDCTPFCELCEGNQEITNAEGNGTKGKEKMKITDWDNNPLTKVEEHYQLVLENFHDIHEEEALRLALFIYGNISATDKLTPERLEEIRSDENDAFQGEFRDAANFAEYWFTEVDEQPISPNLVIDWEATYNSSLSYDFFNYGIITRTEGEPMNLLRFFWRSY